MKPEASSNPQGLPGAQTARVAELVNYQDRAVVSREIIKNSNESVTIFAFANGQGLSEHTAPFDALAQVVEDETKILILGSRRSRGSR